MTMLTNPAAATPDFQALSDLGFSVFPLPRGEKAPKMSWKEYQQRHASDDEVSSWQGQSLNVGIVTGPISNLFALDVDSGEAQELINELGLPKTPTVRTAKGAHYLFRYPPFEVKNRVRVNGVALDVRGKGGYIVGPGSLHPDGPMYQWEVTPEECDFAQLPAEVLALIEQGSSTREVARQDSLNGQYLEAGNFTFWLNRQISEQLAILKEAEEGERNSTLFKTAVSLANHVAALKLDWNSIAEEIKPVALTIGLTGQEIDSTLQSAWDRGQENPTGWLKAASEWVYLGAPDRFWNPEVNQELRPEALSRQ